METKLELATPALAVWRGWDHMWGWGGGMVVGWLVMILLAGGLVWLVYSLTKTSGAGAPAKKTPLEILDERYARGEIEREDYLQRRADLDR